LDIHNCVAFQIAVQEPLPWGIFYLGHEMARTNWLIIESLANWKVDKKNGFSHFGFTKRFYRLKDLIKAGDHLFTYVTGIRAFSDIREVTKDGLRDLPRGGDYELSLPYCIDTKPLLILPQDGWLSIHEVKDRLKLTAGQKHWGQVLRAAPRQLEKVDADLLTPLMQKRVKA
jgi:hypothetical protein